MTITSKEDAQDKLLQKIGEIVVKIVPIIEKLKYLLGKYFAKLKPEINLQIPGSDVSIKLSFDGLRKEGIAEALISLDNLVNDLGLRLVIVFDEFQEILRMDKDTTLQASIRHAVERATRITYLFSGSKHRPLRRMFNGKENPLYALCETMELAKIEEGEYISFINNAAKEKWGKPLRDEVIEKILFYSDRYPKYINALCGCIWIAGNEPTVEIVDELWRAYVFSKKTDITEDLSDLTLNQRRLLQWLCSTPTREPYSKHTLTDIKMSQSSVQSAMNILLEKDFVIEEEGIYKVLDAILISYFKMF